MLKIRRNKLLPGDTVEVCGWEEIVQTLDENGSLEGLPFMPEMMKYCGGRFKVRKRLERTCEEAGRTMRRIQNVVFLEELRCDGSAHSDCQRACFIFWKEAWLKRISEKATIPQETLSAFAAQYPYRFCLSDGQYICQSTELIRAASPLPRFDPRTYVRDLRARNTSVARLLRLVAYALFLRIREVLTGKSYAVLKGAQRTTPVVALGLTAGERVRVKTRLQIEATLDKSGCNQGLAFTTEMLQFCGGVFRVKQRLENMISDSSRKIIHLKNTVILEDVVCDGCSHIRGGCPRENYHFWREIWLERVRDEK